MVNPFSAGKTALQLRSKMKKMQDDMRAVKVEGTSDKNRVKISVNGLSEITDIQIEDELLAPDKKDLLKKAFISAYNDARKKLEKESKNMMSNPDISKLMEMFS